MRQSNINISKEMAEGGMKRSIGGGGRSCCHLCDGKLDVTSQPEVTLAESPTFTRLLQQHHREQDPTPEVLLSKQGCDFKKAFSRNVLKSLGCLPQPPVLTLVPRGPPRVCTPPAQLCSTNAIEPSSGSASGHLALKCHSHGPMSEAGNIFPWLFGNIWF